MPITCVVDKEGAMALDEMVAQMVDPNEFVRLVNAVHVDMYPRDFQVVDGTRGDNGNDGYVASERRMIAIYCPVKPEQRRDSDYRTKIESDLKKAIALRDDSRYAIEAWTFITPRKLADGVIAWMRALGRRHGLRVLHQEASFLAGELQRRPHLIRGFPTFAQLGITEKLEEILRHVRPEQGAPDRAQRVDGEQVLGHESRPSKVPADEAGAERVEQLRAGYPSPAAKAEVKALAYATTDPVVETNAIHLLMRWWAPADDDLAEFHSFADRGIARSRQLGANGSEATLHAQRASITAFEMNRLMVEQHFSTMMSLAIGFPSPDDSAAHRKRIQDLSAAFSAQGVAATEVVATADGRAGVTVGDETLVVDRALIATGIRPNSAGLADAGVALDPREYVQIDDRMATSVPGLWAIGDVTGKLALAHVGQAQGIVCAEAIAGHATPVLSYLDMPRATYCSPQIASFGLTEAQARETIGEHVSTARFDFMANGKALGMGEATGFVKLVIDRRHGELLGAHLIGPEVTELLPELTLARANELTVHEIARNVHAHPTLSEALLDAVHGLVGGYIHK